MAITPTQSKPEIPLQPLPTGDQDARPSFEVSGLDLSAIGNSIVRMTVPLRGGKFSLVAPHALAETKIYNNTVAKVSFGVNQLAGKPTIGSANLTFTPPIKIKNPAAAFKPTGGRFAKIVDVDYLKDKLADIIVHGIHVGRDGRMHIDGYLKVGILSKKPLSEVLKPSDLANLNGAAGKGIDLQRLLHDIGAIVDEATFSVESHANEERELALSALGIRAWTQKATAHAKLSGKAALAHDDIHVCLDPKSSVRFGDTRASLGGELLIADVAQKPEMQAHVSFDVEPNRVCANGTLGAQEMSLELIDHENRLKGHAFIFRGKDGRVQVKDASSVDLSLAARAHGDVQIGNQNVCGKLHDVHLRAQLRANFSANEDGFRVSSGEARAELKARDIEAIYQGIDVRAPGTYTIGASVPAFRYDSTQPSPAMQGSVAATADMPGLDSFQSHLSFSLREDGSARVDHTRKGVTEFLKPYCDLVPEQKRDGITPGFGSAPIGSAEFESRCERLGKARIHSNNYVELLIDGVESLPKRLELINNAKKTIRMQTMVFKDDKAGAQVADALCAAVARGVDVKVIVDALGNAETFGDMIMMNPIYGHLRQGGVHLEIHNNSIGEGILEILGAISNNEKITENFSIEDLSNPQKMLETLHLFAKAALNEHDLGLSAEETKKLAYGLNRVLGASKDETSIERVRDLARITEDKILELSEILELVKHNAHLNHRWHEKYLIVDGIEAIVGGVNSADEYLLGGTGIIVTVSDKTSEAWRDTDVYLKGDAVKDVSAHFADNYSVLTGKPLTLDDTTLDPNGDYRVQMVHSQPHIDGRSTILDLNLECLASLSKGDKAYLENAYFVPSGRTMQLEDALIEAAKRGVDVRVLMNSETSMDVKQVAYSAVFSQRRMLEGGVRVFERTGDRMMHSKVAVFGSKVAAVGSWNADNRASSLNNESSAFVHDSRFAQKVEDMIANDMKEGFAREVHLDEIAYLPVNTEIRNAGQALLGDLL